MAPPPPAHLAHATAAACQHPPALVALLDEPRDVGPLLGLLGAHVGQLLAQHLLLGLDLWGAGGGAGQRGGEGMTGDGGTG